MGGNVNDFLYVYTNAAEPGGFSAFTDRLLRGLTKAGPTVAMTIAGGKIGAAGGPAAPLTMPIGRAIGAAIGLQVFEDVFGFCEDMCWF